MRKITVLFAFFAAAILSCASSWAQQPAPASQTPRQALMEMFFNKTPGTFVKHLPAATRAALEKSGALTMLEGYSNMAHISTQGQNVQTFETGSVMVSGVNTTTGEKYEVAVLNDAARGDEDDIELSMQSYKDGRPQRTPFMPRMIFTMKQEGQVWTLNEVSFTMHIPLADPDFLKAFTEKMQPQTTNHAAFVPHAETTIPIAGSDDSVLTAMRTILKAEVTYASTYSTVGYTCTLSNLDGFGGGEPNERQAMLINSSLASGKKYGFIFMLSECTGDPAATFHLSAATRDNSSGRKAFCTDQSGVIRSSEDGNPATCFASGKPVQ